MYIYHQRSHSRIVSLHIKFCVYPQHHYSIITLIMLIYIIIPQRYNQTPQSTICFGITSFFLVHRVVFSFKANVCIQTQRTPQLVRRPSYILMFLEHWHTTEYTTISETSTRNYHNYRNDLITGPKKHEDLYARNRYQGQGQVITCHRYCGM